MIVLLESCLRIAGASLAMLTLGMILLGIGRSLGRTKGASTGRADRWLRAPMLILVSTAYFGACILLWRPLPLVLSPILQAVALVGGTLLLFPGMALVLWARLTLDDMYSVSSSMGVELFAGHRLVTNGPFAHVRHPMYLGLMLAGCGGILLYRTWTTLFLLVTFLGVIVRSRREEHILAAEFGDQWHAYRRAVRGWFPRLRAYRQARGDEGSQDAQ